MIKIIKRIIDIVFIFIIIILSLYFVLRFTGKVSMFKVQTGSMESGIHVNDYIFVWKNDSYEVGDVITYNYEGYYITHRIVKKDGKKYITKGDANNTEDEEIDESQITGKVLFNGGLLNFVNNYKFAIAAGMLVLYIVTCYINKQDDKQERNNEKNKN